VPVARHIPYSISLLETTKLHHFSHISKNAPPILKLLALVEAMLVENC
jgi:hypothetical protein